MWDSVTTAFVLGLVGGSVPGPFLTAVFTEILRMGFARSLKVILWGFIAETGVIALILLVAYIIDPPQAVFYGVSFAGAAFLLYLAWRISRIKKIVDGEGQLFTFAKICAISILNGPLYIFWITVCTPLAFDLGRTVAWGPVIFLAVFQFGWLVSTAVWAYLFSRFRNVLTRPHFAPYVFTAMALILAFFGVRMIVSGVRYFIS